MSSVKEAVYKAKNATLIPILVNKTIMGTSIRKLWTLSLSLPSGSLLGGPPRDSIQWLERYCYSKTSSHIKKKSVIDTDIIILQRNFK